MKVSVAMATYTGERFLEQQILSILNQLTANDETCNIINQIIQKDKRVKLYKCNEKEKKEFLFTQGLNQFDFLDYEEFCNQVVNIVSQTKVNGIINVCSGRPEKLADRVECFIEENHYNIKLKYGVFPNRPYDSKAIWGDDYKLKLINTDC